MCKGCYENYGSPEIFNSEIFAVSVLIDVLYKFDGGESGGNLHIQLDDWNLDDCHFEAFEEWSEYGTIDQPVLERRIFDMMKKMSVRDRASALGLQEGFWGDKPCKSK